MSDSVAIEGRKRDGVGKSYSRKLRKTGYIPANLIGKAQSSPIEIEAKWLSKAWQNGKTFTLKMDGSERQVKIQELQIHAASRKPLHVDLMDA